MVSASLLGREENCSKDNKSVDLLFHREDAPRKQRSKTGIYPTVI